MTVEDPTLPLTIVGQRQLAGGNVGFDAITAYGRRVSAVVPFWNTTLEGIDDALRESWRAQIRADVDRLAVLASIAADVEDPDALDDSDTDATTG